MTITNQIKTFRTRQNMTQEDLATAVGVSRQTIIAMEKGNYTPSLMLAMQLAQAFKVRVEELFSLKWYTNSICHPEWGFANRGI